ncbi:MAG: MerR family transcriptional regulator, partial [Sphingobacteriales bacterium]
MHSFSIKDIENLSGIKAHTLRIWEMRYGIVKPIRKHSKHRKYGVEELKRILRISHLYNQGFRISRIAQMTDEDICRLTTESQSNASQILYIN